MSQTGGNLAQVLDLIIQLLLNALDTHTKLVARHLSIFIATLKLQWNSDKGRITSQQRTLPTPKKGQPRMKGQNGWSQSVLVPL